MVWEALQLSTGRRRAVKLLHAELAEDPRTMQRFEQEALIGSRIPSDHVVEVVAAGIDERTGAPWLAMELLEGEDLASHLARQGEMDPEKLLGIMRQLCHALAAAHRVGVVHRDLKPENVFLARSRHVEVSLTVKVLDFGIAKLIAETTRSGTAPVGTPLFMAPEQCGGKAVSCATDVWALGLVAFRCLTGSHYWLAAQGAEVSVTALIDEIRNGKLEPASRRAARVRSGARVPPGFDDWFSRAVVRDPGARFPDAGCAMVALEHALAVALAPRRKGRRRRAEPPRASRASLVPRSLRRAARKGVSLGLAFAAATVVIGALMTLVLTRCGR